MDPIFLFVGLVVMITILGLFLILGHNPKGSQASEKKIDGTDFIPSQMYMGGDGLGGLAVNERTHQICLFKSASSKPELFPVADLIGSYLIKNGEIIGEGKRSFPNQVVTFSQELHRQKESLIKSLHMDSLQNHNQLIDLLVMVYDPDEPIQSINFLNIDTQEGGIFFEKSLSTAKHWHYVLDGLILEADHLAGAPSEATPEKEVKEMVKASP